MVVSSTGTLIGIIFVAICALVLIGVGVATIQSGRAFLTRARIAKQEVVWHKQILILFGLCNFVFASLLILILFLMVLVIETIKIIVFVLLGIVFVISMVLIIRCFLVALQTTRNSGMPAKNKEL